MTPPSAITGRHLLAALALLPLLASQCDDVPPTCVPSDRRAVVFFDGSASAGGDDASEAAFEDAVADLTERTLHCQGDQLKGYLLFANTGTAYDAEIEVITPPVDLELTPELDRPQLTSQWERAMEGEREDAALLLRRRLLEQADVPAQARMETDLLGSLRLVQRAFEGQADSSTRRVLYLSDMHESTRRTRDFDVRPPSDVAEARAWADEDVTRLVEEGDLAPGGLDGVEVTVVRSTLGIGRQANEVRAYWTAVFEALGASDVDMP